MAGTARGRRIEAPPGDAVRPTTDRVREATFNALWSMGVLDGAEVLDLFAGSGANGLEALSRGAARATFVERDRRTADVVRRNVEHLGFAERARVVVADALDHAPTAGHIDLVLCDPPYAFDGWDELLGSLRAEVVVAESDRPVEPPVGWELARSKRYGGTFVTILTATSHDPPE
ncbi:16S rRNA (guanine(966)-N(2))-methyltransferase RsmD [Actinomarinicola tropica]|uniref:16S rRNA (guanine(966)-N(2))-methyltransferase RsmD n=1 Tax=Actinomarinicola tropica TaxID=2789776 RepID=UPI001E29DCA6|nr:16S rRNA (guanine(966)-N(2))-methyltransferase RsmD [Actinomarinicola tropica]